MRHLIIFYNLLITSIITIFAFTSAANNQDLLFPLAITPLVIYFLKELIKPSPHRLHSKATSPRKPLSKIAPSASTEAVLTIDSQDSEILNPEILSDSQVKDIDRRLFLKLIGSAGLTTFIFSLFTEKAHGAFFGSMPGPGVVGLKDSSGNPIDPAEKHPTDGYNIAQLDDTSSANYAYYGFVNKDGNWYLQRETLTGVDIGQYLYSKGSSGFSTAWTNRVSPTPPYNTFDNIF